MHFPTIAALSPLLLLLLGASAAPAAEPQGQGAFGSCFASTLLITDCASQAERLFSNDVNLQNEEALQCILDSLVVETRAQRLGRTYPIDFARSVQAADDPQGSVILFNKPGADETPIPFASALFTETGQQGGSVVSSLRFWRRRAYVVVIPGILTRLYDDIFADLVRFIPTLPDQSPPAVKRAIRLRYGRYGYTTRGLTCRRR